MQHVMNPTRALLNAKIAPFSFGHQVRFGHQTRQIIGQNDMTVGESTKQHINQSNERLHSAISSRLCQRLLTGTRTAGRSTFPNIEFVQQALLCWLVCWFLSKNKLLSFKNKNNRTEKYARACVAAKVRYLRCLTIRRLTQKTNWRWIKYNNNRRQNSFFEGQINENEKIVASVWTCFDMHTRVMTEQNERIYLRGRRARGHRCKATCQNVLNESLPGIQRQLHA